MKSLHKHVPGAALCLLAFGAASSSVAAAERPNILFLFADDWGKYASAYSALDGPGGINDVVRTPHFDRLAEEGVLFRNAHVSAPSCTPCRSALLTGQHFWRTNTGAILRGAEYDFSLPSYPVLLREAGYHIGYTCELYDLRKDPHEANNVANDPAYANVRERLEQELMTELRETGDPHLIEDGKFFETPPIAGPLPEEEEFWDRGSSPLDGRKGK